MKELRNRKVIGGFVAALLLLGGNPASGAGQDIGSLSHVHSVRAFGDQVILGTHEGLFRYVDEKNVLLIGKEIFDVMGLAVLGKKLSDFPEATSTVTQSSKIIAVGAGNSIYKSKDGGKTFKKM